MKSKRLYVDMHVLQTMPPSCVNRDDTGSPKTAIYGGATRARVSSQAWKRAMRQYFADLFRDDEIGKRTVNVVAMVIEQMKALSGDIDVADAEKKALKALKFAGLNIKEKNEDDNGNTDDGKNKVNDSKKKNVSEALFFFSKPQARAIAELSIEGCSDSKEYKEALKRNPSFDMVLFGRMLAGNTDMKYDAAAQVAHSISTHAVTNEYDYFTAVDDYIVDDKVGAAHLGTIEFNSSTLYRYATVNVYELVKQLGDVDSERVVRGFVEAFVKSIPSGKQNTFANNSRADLVYIAVREDQPINLCGAFESPIVSQNGYVKESIKAMAKYTEKSYASFIKKPLKSYAVGEGFEDLAEVTGFDNMLDSLGEYIKECVNALKVK